MNILDDLNFDAGVAYPSKFTVIEKGSKDVLRKAGDLNELPEVQSASYNKKSIVTQRRPDDRSEAINFGKVASSTRKVDAKKTNSPSPFSKTATAFNKKGLK